MINVNIQIDLFCLYFFINNGKNNNVNVVVVIVVQLSIVNELIPIKKSL